MPPYNPYAINQPQQEQQQQQGMSPLQGLNMYSQFSGGGEGGLSNLFGGGGGGAAGGEAAAAGGSGGGGSSFLASAGPWAALAAAIIINENEAIEGGYRDEDKGDYALDVVGGKVLEQDVSKRWVPKLFGEDLEHDDLGIGADMLVGSDLATLDFSNAWDTFKNKGLLSKIFG